MREEKNITMKKVENTEEPLKEEMPAKSAQRSNQASQEELQLKTIIDSSPVSIWYKDTRNNFIRVNKAAAKIANRSVDEIEGHSTDEVFPAESEKFYEDDLEVINSGKPKLGIIEPTTANGITTWVRTDKVPWFDREGNIAGVIAFALDITDRINAEEKLRLSEARYRQLFESAKDGILLLNAVSGQIVDVNPFLLQMIGYSREELSGKELWNIEVFKNIAESEKEFIELKDKGYFRFDDIILKNSNGNKINVEFVVNGFRLDHEEVIQCNIHNISEQKQTEKALRESVQLFQSLFNASPDAIVLIDPHHPSGVWPIIDCNEAACKMNGYQSEELIGQSIDILNTTIGKPDERIAYLENLRKNGTIHIEAFHRHKDGHIISVEVSTSIIVVDGRELVLGIDRDITDRKRAEMQIQESEKHFHTLADSGQALIWTSGIDKKCDYFNRPWLNFTGRTIEQEIGNGWTEGVHPDDLQRCIDIYSNAFDRREKFSMDYRIRNADGEYRWIQDNGMPRYNSKDEFIGYIGHCLDIAEHKRTEEALRQSQLRLQTLVQTIPDLIWLKDVNGVYLSCNIMFERLFGAKEAEIIGKTDYDFVDCETADFFRKNDRIAMEAGKPTSNEEWLTFADDGHRALMETTKAPMYDVDGKIIGVIGIAHDITKRKLAEEKTRETEERFRMVFENVFDGIAIHEEDFDLSKRKLIDCNEQYAVMAGIPRDELLKMGNIQHLQKSLEETSDSRRINSLETKNAFQGTYTWNRPDGKENIIEYIGVPITWHGKSYSIGIDRDVTEKKQMLDDLIASKEKAEESDRLKSAFLANMSHEIRTPLNSIIGFSDLLLDPFFGLDQHAEFANIIKENGNNLLSIISNIMDLSKIEAGQAQIKKTHFSVNQLITDIKKEFSFKANEKGVELRIDLDQNEVIYLESDQNKLRQILINFVSNALKFTDIGYIELGIRTNKNSIQFHVKDTGIGIPAKFHDTIFERFRQVETAFTRKYGGNGLGLPISKSLVELLGGKIWMESEQGKGTTFYFTIPV